ncbi:MAG TPA: hypothetical protein VIP28_10750 [Nocardioides sp.]
MHTHTPTEWLAAGSLGLTAISLIRLALAFVDTDLAYFDPRPAAHRVTASLHRGAVYAGHDLNRAAASARHHLAPTTALLWHAVFAAREMARDLAALLLMLTTIPTGDRR